MSKERPYFKFRCDEWLTGDVTLELFSVQGLFTSICAYYWKKNCSTTIAKLKRRYSTATEEMWQTLVDENIMKCDDSGLISINFLDEQWKEMDDNHQTKAEAGRKGAKKRWGNNSTPKKVPLAKHGNREVEREKEKEKKKKYGIFKNVTLKDSEVKKLGEDFGKEKASAAVKFLSEYREEKGYRNKSDYLSIRRWVLKAVDEQKKNPGKSTGSFEIAEESPYTESTDE